MFFSIRVDSPPSSSQRNKLIRLSRHIRRPTVTIQPKKAFPGEKIFFSFAAFCVTIFGGLHTEKREHSAIKVLFTFLCNFLCFPRALLYVTFASPRTRAEKRNKFLSRIYFMHQRWKHTFAGTLSVVTAGVHENNLLLKYRRSDYCYCVHNNKLCYFVKTPHLTSSCSLVWFKHH